MKISQLKKIINEIEEQHGEDVELYLNNKVEPFFYEIISCEKDMSLDYIIIQPKLVSYRQKIFKEE